MPLGEGDRPLRAVGHREVGFVVLAWRDEAIAEDRPVSFVVVAEQARGDVVAAAVALAAPGVDLYFHWAAPLNETLWVPGCLRGLPGLPAGHRDCSAQGRLAPHGAVLWGTPNSGTSSGPHGGQATPSAACTLRTVRYSRCEATANSSVASGSSSSTADAIAVMRSRLPEAVVMSNHASQVSSVPVMNAVMTTACRRRHANHAVRARPLRRTTSKPTQVERPVACDVAVRQRERKENDPRDQAGRADGQD